MAKTPPPSTVVDRERLKAQHAKLKRAKGEASEAAQEASTVSKGIKEAGVDMIALAFVMKLEKKDIARAQIALKNVQTYAEVIGLLDQSDIFANADETPAAA